MLRVATRIVGNILARSLALNARGVFFGIIDANYWTIESEQLFRNSINWLAGDETAPSITDISIDDSGDVTISWITDDNSDLGTFFTFNNFTISLWVYPGSTQVQYADIFDNNHTGARNFVCQQNNVNTNQYEFACFNSTINNASGTGFFTLSANTWHYLTFTWNNSVASAYINGVFYSSGGAANPITYNAQNLRLAGWYDGGRNWNGRMGNFMVHNRVLTAQEIAQNYNALKSRYI